MNTDKHRQTQKTLFYWQRFIFSNSLPPSILLPFYPSLSAATGRDVKIRVSPWEEKQGD